LAQRYDEFLAAGVRLAGVSVDSPARNAAMITKLRLPFTMLSDPDGTQLLQPLDAWNPGAPRGDIGRPGVFVFDADGNERFGQVGRDFADRITEDELLERVEALALSPTDQPPLARVDPQPGDDAMPVRALLPYSRGAKFAAKAMGLRHPPAEDDAKRYVAQMDRYMAAVRRLRDETGS
jgi:alkyl hydroperoxide reductase subunit AhpC